MCRLALFNREAILFLGHDLDVLLCHLEKSLGGDGNGIGMLWQESEHIKVRKGVHFQAKHAAGELRFAVQQGADWSLFHTRMATAGGICSRACHPFQRGRLVLAHNGHDDLFAQLGAATQKPRSDSSALTEYWAKRQVPIALLSGRRGVFLGFHQNQPFVVKGQVKRDLVLAWHQASGALMFVSELPQALRQRFDLSIEVGRITWQGEPLDFSAIERRPEPEPKKAHVSTDCSPIPALLPIASLPSKDALASA